MKSCLKLELVLRRSKLKLLDCVELNPYTYNASKLLSMILINLLSNILTEKESVSMRVYLIVAPSV